MKHFFLILLLFAIFYVFASDQLIGMIVDPRLEKTLTNLFDMPVTIRGLRIRPFLGRVQASGITFMNQPQFAARPHFDAQTIHFDIDFLALRNKEVKIGTVTLDQLVYFIDRIATDEGPRNNVKTWYRHSSP